MAEALCGRSQYSHTNLFPWSLCNSVGLHTDCSSSRKRTKGRGNWQLERGTHLARQEFSWFSECVPHLGRQCGLSLALHPKNAHGGPTRESNLHFGPWEWDTEGTKRNRRGSEGVIWMEVLRSERKEGVPGTAGGCQGSSFRTVGGEDVDLQESRLPWLSCSRT